ncbi:VIT1/CCC1 transporter family protein [Dietzia sp.]|uniref:VIT1/CCC1 transporter family protein n=1 Tax=Dietzia sp. TaxID=1871616 RepID=UPI002FDB0D9B
MSSGTAQHPSRPEPHSDDGFAQRLNGLRAGVLGANDGIVSVAAVVVGVAGASSQIGPILTAGAAALVGGAVSMALGEYVSVSSQRDSENSLIAKERSELEEDPEGELAELASLYEQRGLSPDTARQVALELSDSDALGAHLDAELGIDTDDIVSPWQAAAASFLSFFVGALLPIFAIIVPPPGVRIPVTFVVTVLALAATGAVAARLGGASQVRGALRMAVGGALALAVTFAVGTLFGEAGLA